MVNEAEKKMQKARKGFTLVELLIVIIIIGILAGAMMLVAGTSRDSAEAAKIISDLRSVKSAAMMWMADNPDVTSGDWEAINDSGSGSTRLDQLNKYLDRPIETGSNKPYKFIATKKTGTNVGDVEIWAIGLDVSGKRAGVKDNLKKQAEASGGLYGGTDSDISISGWPPTSTDLYTGGDYIYVIFQ